MTGPPADPVPDDVRRFVLDFVDSVPALEALLLMRRQPERQWTVSMMAAALYLEPRDVAPVLAELGARDLCSTRSAPEPTYAWPPPSDKLRAMVDRVAEAYAKHLVPITHLIHSKPRPGVRSFLDAFRLRGPE
jgi:hypothetical protein